MMTDPRATLLTALDDPTLRDLEGRFHAHLTVDGEPSATVCATLGARATIIDLDGARAQRDGMVTIDHRGRLSAFGPRLLALVDGLGAAGLPVRRVKVEHGSVPTIAVFDRHRYREVHVKLAIPRDAVAAAFERLEAGRATWGYALSRNPREQTDTHLVQFVNLRLYEGDVAAANARVAALVAWLAAHGLAPVEVQQETAVIDTDHGVDAWWA
jgi:hypothetical protein